MFFEQRLSPHIYCPFDLVLKALYDYRASTVVSYHGIEFDFTVFLLSLFTPFNVSSIYMHEQSPLVLVVRFVTKT